VALEVTVKVDREEEGRWPGFRVALVSLGSFLPSSISGG
jgi:hypothetical protein